MMGRDPGQPVQTRVPSHGQNECSSSRISTLHLWRRDPDRSEKTCAASWAVGSGPYGVHILWVAARSGPLIFEMVGRGPARPMNVSDDQPWPDLVNKISKTFGPSEPSSSQVPDLPVSARLGPLAHEKPFY